MMCYVINLSITQIQPFSCHPSIAYSQAFQIITLQRLPLAAAESIVVSILANGLIHVTTHAHSTNMFNKDCLVIHHLMRSILLVSPVSS